MGDDCHMRHQATTMLLLRQTLPAIAERAPRSVPNRTPVATNGHFALTVTIACARAALARTIAGTPASSLIVFISRNGTDTAVQLAGLPDRWFTSPSPRWATRSTTPGCPRRTRRRTSATRARGVLRPRGRSQRGQPRGGSRPSSGAAWPRRSSAPGRSATSASARASASASRPSTGRAFRWGRRPRIASTWGRRRSSTPASSTGVDGGQIGAGIARMPLEPIRDAAGGAGRRAGRLPVSTEWDARTYDRVSGPQVAWGRAVIDRIPLRGDETALDAGCGTGRVTRLLAERLPRGRVIGVEGAAPWSMRPARAWRTWRRGSACGMGTSSSWSWRSRLTWSSRPPPSTGSSTTTPSFGACSPRSGPAGGWWPSAAGGATSPPPWTRRPRSPLASPTPPPWAACPTAGCSPDRRTPWRAWRRPASRTPAPS